MKKVTVISGKGGTGKTTVTANLAFLAPDLVLADCDVDAPNMHLLMKPQVLESKVFQGAKVAIKDDSKCIDCGLCYELCNFNAIKANFEVDEVRCEGCGLCVAKCPTNALKLELEDTGEIYYSKTSFGPMIHAKLNIGGENSGKLVAKVKEEAQELLKQEEKSLLLIDGSPGIGCPVIASVNGVDYVLIVTEPTKSALADLKRLLKMVKHFDIKALLVINKFDLNEELCREIEAFSAQEQLSIIAKIPFDKSIVEAMREGRLLSSYFPEAKAAVAIKELWQNLKNKLGG